MRLRTSFVLCAKLGAEWTTTSALRETVASALANVAVLSMAVRSAVGFTMRASSTKSKASPGATFASAGVVEASHVATAPSKRPGVTSVTAVRCGSIGSVTVTFVA